MMTMKASRREFLQGTGAAVAGYFLGGGVARGMVDAATGYKPKVSAHLWVYASAHPPKWDATPDLERLFPEIKSAGYDGLELMAVMLQHDDAVDRISKLAQMHGLPVSGSSYGAAMWDATKHDAILAEVAIVLDRLHALKGTTFGLSVGDAKRMKTDAELDAQAVVLKEIRKQCGPLGIEMNLHNHTYEVENGMHDLKGTLARIPDVKLGPDFNWLIRGGVDPVAFIQQYGQQITYCHLRDQYADGTWTEYLGQGVTNFSAIAAALKAKQFRGRAAVELAFPANFKPEHTLPEDWTLSRKAVRANFGW